MNKSKIYLIGGTVSIVLSIIGFVVFALNCGYLGKSAAVREVHNAYAAYTNELSAEAMNALAIVGIVAGLTLLTVGVVLIITALKKKKEN